MSDLYPRQRMGFWIFVVGALLVATTYLLGLWPVPGTIPAWTLLIIFWTGIGLGMLSGNTRTKRVPGNRR